MTASEFIFQSIMLSIALSNKIPAALLVFIFFGAIYFYSRQPSKQSAGKVITLLHLPCLLYVILALSRCWILYQKTFYWFFDTVFFLFFKLAILYAVYVFARYLGKRKEETARINEIKKEEETEKPLPTVGVFRHW